MKNIVFIILLLFLISCGQNVDDIYSNVTLNAVCGDMQLPAIRVDNSVKGNYFSNLNTGKRYDYPLFVNGKCTLKVLKGVYIFAFDGTATLTDGSTRRVRCYEHRSPNDSVNIIDDDVEITIELLPL